MLEGKHKGVFDKHPPVKISIKAEQVTRVDVGWDKVYSRWDDRLHGFTFKPIKVTYLDDENQEQALYLVIGFGRLLRHAKEKTWGPKLQKWAIDRQQQPEL